jgi:hypothetical protein
MCDRSADLILYIKALELGAQRSHPRQPNFFSFIGLKWNGRDLSFVGLKLNGRDETSLTL